MKKKYMKEEWEIQSEHQMSDDEFMIECGKVLQMEVKERMSSHNSEVEEMLSLYATDEQWKKHPMMYELIMGDGLNNELFELALNQPFYANDMVFKAQRIKKTNEVKFTRIK